MESILQAHKTAMPERQVLVSLSEKFRYIVTDQNVKCMLKFSATINKCHVGCLCVVTRKNEKEKLKFK